MIHNVIPAQRLFDHHQAEIVKCLEVVDIRKLVCRVGVGHESNVWKPGPDSGKHFEVPARFDLQFDSLITEGQVFVHAFQESIQIGLNAEANAHGNPFPLSSDQLR